MKLLYIKILLAFFIVVLEDTWKLSHVEALENSDLSELRKTGVFPKDGDLRSSFLQRLRRERPPADLLTKNRNSQQVEKELRTKRENDRILHKTSLKKSTISPRDIAREGRLEAAFMSDVEFTAI